MFKNDLQDTTMAWHKAYEVIIPHVFQIKTPDGSGTGFLFAFNRPRTLAAIATAHHVVSYANDWMHGIRLVHHQTSREVFFGPADRAILIDYKRDSAAIIVPTDKFDLPENPITLFTSESYKKVGVELGWVGFPAVAPGELCLFTGGVSAFVTRDDSYLIDGVAINGVSGGPVFTEIGGDPELVGIISAYLPNRQPSGTFPGLSVAHDLTYLHQIVASLQTLGEAREKSAEAKEDHDSPPSETRADMS